MHTWGVDGHDVSLEKAGAGGVVGVGWGRRAAAGSGILLEGSTTGDRVLEAGGEDKDTAVAFHQFPPRKRRAGGNKTKTRREGGRKKRSTAKQHQHVDLCWGTSKQLTTM